MGSQHNEHKLSRRGFLPFTKMNFICDLLLRNWLPTIFALEADPNVVPSSRQSGIGRRRSNLEWRQLGDWNRTSSTLVRRSRTVGLGGASVVLTCDQSKIGRLHQRQVGRLRIEKWSASNRKFLAGLISELSRSSWGLYRVPEIVTRGRFPDGGESDSTWRIQEARHVGSDTIAPGF